MREGRHLLVVHQVGDDEVVHHGRPQDGVHVDVVEFRAHIGHQFGPRGAFLIDFRHRTLDGPFVFLDEEDGVRVAFLVGLYTGVGNDAPLVQGTDFPHDRGLQDPQVQAFGRLDVAVGHIGGIAVVRDDPPVRLALLFEDLLLGLENREIELGDEVLVLPRRALPVVVAEFGGTR